MTFVLAISTKLASSAYRRNPFDTSAITRLPEILHVCANGYNDASALMACDAFGTFGHLEVPLIMEQGFVRGTEATVVYLDENLVRSWFRDRNLLDGNRSVVAGALFDGRLLCFGELHNVTVFGTM